MRIFVGIIILIVGFFTNNQFLKLGAIIIIFFPLFKKLLSALMKLSKKLFRKIGHRVKGSHEKVTASNPSDDLFSTSEVDVQRGFSDDLFTGERKQDHKIAEIHVASGFDK